MPQDPESQGNQGKPGFENEGEGNKTAARRYNKATEEYVHSGRSDQAAEEAKEALDSEEGESLREAEDEARETKPEAEPQP